nr:MAG TPA: hypothetical protein [Caudoviricetes sp.]
MKPFHEGLPTSVIQSLLNTLYGSLNAMSITEGVTRSSFIAKMKGFRVSYPYPLIAI